ncbi:serine/threonine-protein kinase [Catenuloplanes japonicus]|uniref:hypothetical protein n=1 Tax=Catenuloplanes japonicus TaxID=33876 RepID=UPI0005256FD7|nr:hypothetical protein [Catenuloplanes japonicus]
MISPSSAWATLRPSHTLLVVVRTGVTLTRLLDVLTLTADDRRIQTVFTHDPDNPPIFSAGTPGFLHRLAAPLITWQEAVSRRFDLAVAASENDRLHELDAPILLVPHGLGFHKYYPGTTTISGMDPDRLTHQGRVVPAAIALTHPGELPVLAAACPPAAARAVVVGDPCLDRMLAGRHRVPLYRGGLGARERTLVVFASTWGPDSLLGLAPGLPERLAAALPADEFAVAAVLHPGIWSAHGPWQVRAWLSRATAAGLRVISPEDGWQATLTAADLVVSDAGSLSLYAALLGRPLLLAGGGPTVVPGSAMESLLARAPRLTPGGDLLAQVRGALAPPDAGVAWSSGRAPTSGYVPAGVVDSPGACASRLRPLIYRLLGLPEPSSPAVLPPPTAPSATASPVPAYVVDALVTDGVAALRRFPAFLDAPPSRDERDHRHVIADLATATHGQLTGATVVRADVHTSPRAWRRDAEVLLSAWPSAVLVTGVDRDSRCHTLSRDGVLFTLTADVDDPAVLASLAYLHLKDPAVRLDMLRLGSRLVPVDSRS